MHCLVTGSGGFLGRYIVEQLVARGDTVRTYSRGRYPVLEALGVETVQGDLADAERLRVACRGIDAVFHTAAVPGVWGPWKLFYETNVVGTQKVLSACRVQGVPRLIFTSSPSVVYDGLPHENANESLPYPETYLCHYPHTKALAEREVLAANGRDGLSTVSLRPHLIWGPRDRHLIPRIIDRAARGRLRRVGDGTNRVSVSYVENVAHAHLLACDALKPDSAAAGRAYFINEPEPVNLWEFVGEIVRRAGLPPIRKSISAGAAWRIGAVLEVVYRVLRLPGEPPMTRFVASQLSTSHWYDVSAARRDLGYEGVVSVEEGLGRMEGELRR